MTPTRKRAAALLLVLGAVVVILPAAVIAARVSTTASLHDRTTEHTMLADELAHAGELFALDWTERRSTQAVIDPATPTPGIVVTEKSWQDGSHTLTLRITAWDQRGMLPAGWIDAAISDATGLAPSATEALQSLAVPFDGLDRIPLGTGLGVHVFPVDPDDPVIGALVATSPQVNEQARRPRTAETRLNLNTAPAALLRAIYRDAGLGGLQDVLRSRQLGEPTTAVPGAIEISPERRIRFATSSDRWSVRVDAIVERVRRSWWIVLQEDRDGWKVVQRLTIPE